MRIRRIILALLFTIMAAALAAQTTIHGTVSVTGTTSLGGIGTAVVLSSISVSPANSAIVYTASQSFAANGTYTNGSQADVTSAATWTSSNSGIANNLGSCTNPGCHIFQCVARGTVTVTATLQSVTGTATLTCQSPTFTPQGTINVSQGSSPVTVVQFTGANGSSPFTFSSTDLPGWLSLTNTGCAVAQVNCSLHGTPSVVAVSNFHIQATDNIGNTACATPGCPVAVNVVASSAEDNTYCNSSEVVIGLSMDGPANPLSACNYTAIAGSSLGGSPTVIYVCPVAQQSGGSTVAGCAAAPQPTPGSSTVPPCYTTGGVFCSTIQGAVNYVATISGCGSDVRLYATIDDTPSGAQNIYTEPTVNPVANINCGPTFSANWWYIRTKQFANLPAPGNRISPAFVGQTAIVGRPSYPPTTTYGIAAGTYMPMWRCEVGSGASCRALTSQMNSSTVGGLFSGLRVMGIMFAAAHGRNSATDLYGNHVCPANNAGNYQCTPGFGGAIVNVGCTIIFTNNCNTPISPTGSPNGTGSQHVILDRIIIAGCDDITMSTCFDSVETLLSQNGGQHMSLIDSYLIGGECIDLVGPCVDGKGTSGGNPQENLNDTAIKIVNNYIEGSSENVFFGGGSAANGIFPTDIEIRRNHMFKPLLWKGDDPSFPGKVQDTFIANGHTGSGYSGTTTCSIDPPLSGTQATCTPIIVSGGIGDVLITNKGSGYGPATKTNGTTYVSPPNIYFADGGNTYTSCASQLNGTVTTSGTTVTWVHGSKFISGLVGNSTSNLITIAGTPYSVAAFNSAVSLTLWTSAGTNTTPVAFTSVLPSRGDCVQPVIGLMNVKNLTELKHGVRVLYEGNRLENVWVGQSDQSAFVFLLTPKNANNLCPTCTIQDVTYRYNYSRGSEHAIQIAQAAATQGGFLSQSLARVSIHDDIFDGMNGPYWSAGTSPISSGSGGCVELLNVQVVPYEVANIRINHVDCIGTLPLGYNPITGSSMLTLITNYNSPLTLLPGIAMQNSIGAGGVKNASLHSSGLNNCLNNACTDQASHGPSEAALRMLLPNSFDTPTSGGTYQKSQVMAVVLTEGGTCTVLPTSITISGGGGSGATAAFNTGAGTSHNAIVKLWSVFPGSAYTSAPTVAFNGATCTVPPAATAYVAGATLSSTSSGCFDHNAIPTAAWSGVIAMNPYPTAQIDPTNNTCDSTTGGHNNTNTSGTDLVGNTWYPTTVVGSTTCTGSSNNVGFVNFLLDGNCAEIPGGDLHLSSGSPFHLGANDGTDIGANADLVLGKSDGSAPSIYTGCTISGGMVICPP